MVDDATPTDPTPCPHGEYQTAAAVLEVQDEQGRTLAWLLQQQACCKLCGEPLVFIRLPPSDYPRPGCCSADGLLAWLPMTLASRCVQVPIREPERRPQIEVVGGMRPKRVVS